jgi:hypothetical protein
MFWASELAVELSGFECTENVAITAEKILAALVELWKFAQPSFGLFAWNIASRSYSLNLTAFDPTRTSKGNDLEAAGCRMSIEAPRHPLSSASNRLRELQKIPGHSDKIASYGRKIGSDRRSGQRHRRMAC